MSTLLADAFHLVWRPIRVVLGGAFVLLVALTFVAPHVEAQDPPYVTCAAYGTMIGTGGPLATAAAEELRGIGAPNPPGIDAALDVIVDAEDETGTSPDAEAIQDAFVVLEGYYGGTCSDVEICPLVRQATATNDESSKEAARLARGLSAPSPPGIDAAFAVVSGAVEPEDTGGLHSSVADAQQALSNYFPCELAFTGASTTTPLAIGGFTFVAAGVLVLTTLRWLDEGQ